jgi:predicted LPLAT superfamily acyltransferase
MSETTRWTQVAEVGTSSALRFAGWFHRSFGRRPSVALAALCAVYFCLTHASARRASSRYLEQMAATPEGRAALGAGPKARWILRHFVEFAISIYDRIVVWGGAIDTMEIDHDGSEKLFEVAREGQGALLLGAHLGNLDMMSFIAGENELRMNVVVYNENAERINAYLETLGGPRAHLIQLRPGSMQAGFEIRACLARGEFVAMMADRTAPNSAAPTTRSTFLGRAAPFPLGPFRLASALGCPVYFVLFVRVAGAKYRTILRTIAEPEAISRGERRKNARELLAGYVALLEQFCRGNPLQWFNFYDFWDEQGS